MKKYIEALVYSNLFVSLCGWAMLEGQLANAGLSMDWNKKWGIIISIFVVYNFCSFTVKEESAYVSDKFRFIYQNRLFLQTLVVIGSISLFLWGLYLNLREIFFLAHLGVICIFYSFSFHTLFMSWQAWRTIPFLKIVLIAYVWAILMVFFPLLSTSIHFWEKPLYWFHFIERFCFLVAITIPFDVRDYTLDQQQRIKTVVTALGKSKAKVIGYCFLLLGFGVALYVRPFLHYPWAFFSIYGMAFLSLFLAEETRKELFFTGFIDGLIALPYGLILLYEKVY